MQKWTVSVYVLLPHRISSVAASNHPASSDSCGSAFRRPSHLGGVGLQEKSDASSAKALEHVFRSLAIGLMIGPFGLPGNGCCSASFVSREAEPKPKPTSSPSVRRRFFHFFGVAHWPTSAVLIETYASLTKALRGRGTNGVGPN